MNSKQEKQKNTHAHTQCNKTLEYQNLRKKLFKIARENDTLYTGQQFKPLQKAHQKYGNQR